MSILVIGEAEQQEIISAIAVARARPTPWAKLKVIADGNEGPTLDLKDRKHADLVETIHREYPSQCVKLGTYEAAISFEEQPAGLMKHLSVSSARRGRVPGPEVMQMVCEAFGFDETVCRAMGGERASVLKPERAARAWVEEFAPGRHAINVVELEP
ncbi:hypothetical protein [Bradyrhizobium sp. 150]|uniref:hypothetical protein n=1 Tax=Bradyrhizobium sp. 150 TaxID=2782625 RepID=UPI001FF87241|nr:hypothetical protein [Bradyrhizobium sp. 150]MCK1670366.1 hypothetical protein [Bradyrhizobium sp. 150]